ncbi:5416_t:CDS:1 [Funneliformis mosseae]|uniref:5416_t:CDS:1 n=1 Tax=Funneliformis mosseae TaxID=27381 RepID=A0A9N9FRI2_FUNMO|nr:5416_t:CDS:1 [Funneliformis mosseae]
MYAAIYGSNMLMFLKSNRAYLNQEELKQKKEFKSFLWTLFNLRFNSYIIPPKKENTNERGNSLMIASPTTSQINKKIINRTIITFTKWVILELAMIVSIKYTVEIPEKPYQLRLLEFFTKGIPAITLPLILAYFNTLVLIYLSISLNYDIFTIFTAILYRLLFHSSSIQDSFLIKMWILTPSEYVSLKEWIITFLFNTKHMFSEPWLASSPRDFWSVRWQLVLNGFFKELGYLPVRNLVAPFFPRKIANMMGVLGALGYSAIIHEYIILGQFDYMTGEHFFFFMIHGVIFILWEAVFGRENKNENAKIKRFLKWVLLMIINLLVLPAFIEPLRRRPERFDFPYARARYYLNL